MHQMTMKRWADKEWDSGIFASRGRIGLQKPQELLLNTIGEVKNGREVKKETIKKEREPKDNEQTYKEVGKGKVEGQKSCAAVNGDSDKVAGTIYHRSVYNFDTGSEHKRYKGESGVIRDCGVVVRLQLW